ncbi:ankyrin repeat-containing protein ITN1-like isoform X2 [Carya illinoinensis]|nr:ankyrin repeat-containing protein ITN1-like isoform X2 [Carya illinoinensis]
MEEGDSPLPQSPADVYAPLLRAILEDNWKAAEDFMQKNPNYCLGDHITKEKGTALHFAAAAKRTQLVENLLKNMRLEELELKTNGNCTALYYAAQSEIVTIAKEMVKKKRNLPLIPKDDIEALPLYAAIMTGNRDMVSYLYSVTPLEELASAGRVQLLVATISSDLYDVALKILNNLNLAREEKESLWFPLKLLAKKPSGIGNKSQPSVWERCLNSCFKGQFCNKAMMQVSAHQLVDRLWKLFTNDTNFSTLVSRHKQLVAEAAKVGNVEFLVILIRSYPNLIWEVDEDYGTLFHVAVEHRQERVFNLIYEIGVLKDNLTSLYVEGNKSMLHLVKELPSLDRLNIISGAALQMQRELLWFQEIEKIMPKSSVNEMSGPEEEKPLKDMFSENHKILQKNGEEWMRNTANSCMLVATLIATVVFPAAFTIPGGNNQETGVPIFLETNWFTVFYTSNAVAMLFSSSSILVFLSILTSRYTERDFLTSLPLKLAGGLVMLVISIVSMLIAFIAACFLVFKSKKSVPVRIIIVAVLAIPICLFGILHYRLCFDIFCSAFCSKSFRSENRLFNSKKGTPIMEIKNDNQIGIDGRTQVRFTSSATSPTTSHAIPRSV